jgi:hypothetical protein
MKDKFAQLDIEDNSSKKELPKNQELQHAGELMRHQNE